MGSDVSSTAVSSTVLPASVPTVVPSLRTGRREELRYLFADGLDDIRSGHHFFVGAVNGDLSYRARDVGTPPAGDRVPDTGLGDQEKVTVARPDRVPGQDADVVLGNPVKGGPFLAHEEAVRILLLPHGLPEVTQAAGQAARGVPTAWVGIHQDQAGHL